MDKKQLKKILSEAKKSRTYREYPNALALLHQVHNAFPIEVNYCYLLGATYFEAKEIDLALEYSEKALELDAKFKETYELLGDIYIKKKDVESAENYYLQASALDTKYTSVQDKLIDIYFDIKNYKDIVSICDNKMSYLKIDISTGKTRLKTMYHIAAAIHKTMALISLKKYEEAIETILYHNKINIEAKTPVSPTINLMYDKQLYKMYFNLGKDHKKIKEYKNLLISEYKITGEVLTKLEKEAIDDIIDGM